MINSYIDALSLIERMEKKSSNGIEAAEYTRNLAKKKIEELGLPQFDDTFDLRTIPEDVLDRGYVSYAPFFMAIPRSSPMYRMRTVVESIDYKGNLEKAREELSNRFPIDGNYQFGIEKIENDIWVGVLTSYISGNGKIIREVMKRMGFYQTNRKNLPEFLYDDKCREWEHMVFKPCEQDDVTDYVKENYQFVYHATPSIFKDNVLKNGIIPSNSNPEVDYGGNALFVMKGDITEQNGEMQRIVNDLYSQAKQRHYKNLSNTYTIFQIDVSALSDTVRFYLDGDEKFGLFSRMTIPPNAIAIYKDKMVADKEGQAPPTSML